MSTSSRKLSVGLLYDDTLDNFDGVSRQVKTLGAWLGSRGHHVFYMCGKTQAKDWAGGSIYSLAKNMKVTFNGNRMSIPVWSSGRLIREVLAHERPDIIHVQVPYSPLMAQRVIAKAHRHSAIVGTFHVFPSGWLSVIGSKLLGYYQKGSFKKIDQLVSVSRPAANFAEEAFSAKSNILPNMVDVSAMRSGPRKPVPGRRIVFLGRLVERKGCRQLIDAFHLLSSRQPDVVLVIGGKGPQMDTLKKYTQSLGLGGKIEFIGYVDEDDKAEFLASADIACFPSLFGESFGVVLVEAMAAGAKVVLGGDNPGYRSVLGAQPDLLINPNDPKAFADRLNLLLSDQNLINRLNKWQNKEVEQYDVNLVGEQYLKIYRQVIANKSANKA